MATPDPSAYLQAYRRAAAGSDDAKASNLAAIRARLGRGEIVDDDEHDLEHDLDPEQPRFRRAASFILVAKPVALSVGIAAASVATIKVGAMTYAAVTAPETEAAAPTEPSDPPEPSAARARSDRGSTADPNPAPAAVPPVGTPIEPPAPSPASSPVSVADPSAAPARARTSPPSASPPADELRREVALMERASNQLGNEHYEALLITLAEHARQFDRGAMVLERHGWAAIAHCRLGHRDAEKNAGSFLRRHGSTALAQKVRRACGSNKSNGEAISSDG